MTKEIEAMVKAMEALTAEQKATLFSAMGVKPAKAVETAKEPIEILTSLRDKYPTVTINHVMVGYGCGKDDKEGRVPVYRYIRNVETIEGEAFELWKVHVKACKYSYGKRGGQSFNGIGAWFRARIGYITDDGMIELINASYDEYHRPIVKVFNAEGEVKLKVETAETETE